jgi:hypothetical protein
MARNNRRRSQITVHDLAGYGSVTNGTLNVDRAARGLGVSTTAVRQAIRQAETAQSDTFYRRISGRRSRYHRLRVSGYRAIARVPQLHDEFLGGCEINRYGNYCVTGTRNMTSSNPQKARWCPAFRWGCWYTPRIRGGFCAFAT